MWMLELPPFVPFFIGALIAAVTRGTLRGAILVAIPILSAIHLWLVPEGNYLQFTFLDYELIAYRVDKLSLMFAYVFHIAALIAIVYSLHVRDTMQQVAGMMYVGSGLGAVFAGDLLTLFVFWELLAFTSVFSYLGSQNATFLCRGHALSHYSSSVRRNSSRWRTVLRRRKRYLSV